MTSPIIITVPQKWDSLCPGHHSEACSVLTTVIAPSIHLPTSSPWHALIPRSRFIPVRIQALESLERQSAESALTQPPGSRSTMKNKRSGNGNGTCPRTHSWVKTGGTADPRWPWKRQPGSRCTPWLIIKCLLDTARDMDSDACLDASHTTVG